MDLDFNWITPVENRNGLWVKRDDLFAPFDDKSINGTKLRSVLAVISKLDDEVDTIVCSSKSTSSLGEWVAAAAHYFGKKCVVKVVPAMSWEQSSDKMIKTVHFYGGETIKIEETMPNGRNVFMIVFTGSRTPTSDLGKGITANQCRSIPKDVETIVVVSGTGGLGQEILRGCKQFNTNVKKYISFEVLGDTSGYLKPVADECGIEYERISMREMYPDYKHGIPQPYPLNEIKLHPLYEAKAYKWLVENSEINLTDNKTLLWVVAAKP